MIDEQGDGVLPDLATRRAIDELVTSFYREVVFDEVLEPVFSDVAEVDWVRHIPVLVEYWATLLLGTNTYRGPIMDVHRHLHGLSAVERVHCDRWYALWVGCVDERWAGPVADRAKRHAGAVMQGMATHLFGLDWSAADVEVGTLPGRPAPL